MTLDLKPRADSPAYIDRIAVNEWLTNVHGDMLRQIARREHRKVRTLDVEDVEQHVMTTLYSRAKGTDFRLWEKAGIADLAIKISREYVNKERIDYMHFSCAYIYTPSMVEAFLQNCVWNMPQDIPDVDGRIDVIAEFDNLPLRQRQVLFTKYGLGERFADADPRRRMADRAVDKITERLNTRVGMKRVELSDAQ